MVAMFEALKLYPILGATPLLFTRAKIQRSTSCSIPPQSPFRSRDLFCHQLLHHCSTNSFPQSLLHCSQPVQPSVALPLHGQSRTSAGRSRRGYNSAAGCTCQLVPRGINMQETAMYVAAWYACSAIFSTYNKKVLRVLPYPWLVTAIQMAISCLCILSYWILFPRPFPLPLEAGPLLGALVVPTLLLWACHVALCASTKAQHVGITSIIRAAEPALFAVAAAFAGYQFSPMVWASLALIWCGAAMAPVHELSFQPSAMAAALPPAVAALLHGLLLKRSFEKFVQVDVLTQYSCVALLSLALAGPAAVLAEGGQVACAHRDAVSKVGSAPVLYAWILLSGVSHTLSTLASFKVLSLVQPITYSVINTLRPVALLLVGIFCFKLPSLPSMRFAIVNAIVGTIIFAYVFV